MAVLRAGVAVGVGKQGAGVCLRMDPWEAVHPPLLPAARLPELPVLARALDVRGCLTPGQRAAFHSELDRFHDRACRPNAFERTGHRESPMPLQEPRYLVLITARVCAYGVVVVGGKELSRSLGRIPAHVQDWSSC